MILKLIEIFLLFECAFYGFLLVVAQFILANWRQSRHLIHLVFSLSWRKCHRVSLYQRALERLQSQPISRKQAKRFIKLRQLKHPLAAFKYYVFLLTLYDCKPLSSQQLILMTVQMQLANQRL